MVLMAALQIQDCWSDLSRRMRLLGNHSALAMDPWVAPRVTSALDAEASEVSVEVFPSRERLGRCRIDVFPVVKSLYSSSILMDAIHPCREPDLFLALSRSPDFPNKKLYFGPNTIHDHCFNWSLPSTQCSLLGGQRIT